MVLRSNVIDQKPAELIEEFDVRTQAANAPVSSLSGGNKQKVVMAREMSRELRVLVASQPTRGVDVGPSNSCTSASSPNVSRGGGADHQ